MPGFIFPEGLFICGHTVKRLMVPQKQGTVPLVRHFAECSCGERIEVTGVIGDEITAEYERARLTHYVMVLNEALTEASFSGGGELLAGSDADDGERLGG